MLKIEKDEFRQFIIVAGSNLTFFAIIFTKIDMIFLPVFGVVDFVSKLFRIQHI